MQILMVSFATGRVDRGGDGLTPVGIDDPAGAEPGRRQRRAAAALGRSRRSSRRSTSTCSAEPFDRQRLRDALRLCVELGRHAAFGRIAGRTDRARPTTVLASDAALDAWMRARGVAHQPHLGHVQDGPGRPTRWRSSISTAGCTALDGLRVADCLDHARLRPRQHQRDRDDDRRAHGRPDGLPVVTTGPVGVITGAGSGIGAADGRRVRATRRAAHAGVAADARVWRTPLRRSSRPAARPCAVEMDVRDPEAVRQLIDGAVERHGRLDFVLANAGVADQALAVRRRSGRCGSG